MIGLVLVSLLSRRFAVSSAHGGASSRGSSETSLLAFANNSARDERINDGYATLFVSGQIVEVILVQVIVSAAS